MSYKDQRKDLGLAPAGSAAPMTTQDGSKWHHGVDAAGIGKLGKIGGEITTVFGDTADAVARAQIKIGRLLNEARELIPGDLQFGMWRAANTPITNKSTANKLMNLAKQVGEGRITSAMVDTLPISTLKELISAPESVMEKVEAKLAAGENVTRADVRGAGDTAESLLSDQAPEFSPEDQARIEERRAQLDKGGNTYEHEPEPKAVTGKEGQPKPRDPKGPSAPLTPPGPATRQIVEKILALNLLERLKRCDTRKGETFKGVKPIEWAWLVFGLEIDPSYLPCPQTVQILYEAMDERIMGELEEDHLHSTLERAYNLINDEY